MVEAYLANQGWHLESLEEGVRSIWSKRDSDRFWRLMVPADPTFGDYEPRLAEALSVIQVAMDVTPGELLVAIAANRQDVLRFRAVQNTDAVGSIPLQEGRNLVDSAYRVLRSAAATTRHKTARVATSQPKPVEDYMRSARLGQTETGSYVLTVLTPLSADGSDAEKALGRVPFERSVNEHLARSLLAARNAADVYREAADFGSFVEAIGDGVSADLCEAIADLVGSDEGVEGIDISFSWAPVVDPPQDERLSQVSFDRTYIQPLRDAAERFRASAESPEEIRGLVETITRHPEEDQGMIVVVRMDQELGRKIRIHLSGEDFDTAADALKRRSFVRCRGLLIREGNYSWLEAPSRFVVEPQAFSPDDLP